MTARQCSKCFWDKDESEFYHRKSGRVDSWCKSCRRDDVKRYRKTHPHNSTYHRAYRLAHREAIAEQRRRKKYGMNFDYSKVLAEQDGRCAICGEPTTLVVDHDHDTGKTRGLLCSNCNIGLGYFLDDPGLLMAASEYAAKWKKGGRKKKK